MSSTGPSLVWLPRSLIVAHDAAMVVVTWLVLRWLAGVAGAPPPAHLATELALAVAMQALVFWRVGLYRGVWRFASIPDLLNLASAAAIGLLLILPALMLAGLLPDVPRRVLVPYPFVLVLMLGLPRLLYRFWKDQALAAGRAANAPRILVLGAGRAAETLLRELRGDPRYHPVGLLDDAPRLKGAKIQGVPVLGGLADLAKIARETDCRLLVIAMPSASAEQMRRVVALCDETGLPFRRISRLSDQLESLDAPVGEFVFREVAIEDLLGRESVQFDWQRVSESLGGRTVLVTGAGGSIGSELARQCARAGVARLILLERAELALDQITRELERDHPALVLTPVLADCVDVAAYRGLLGGLDWVFHAAACKHVPMLEGQLREAVRNNVHATRQLAWACRAAAVRNFVLISTDKAIEPASVLGASKRLAELVCHDLLAGSDTALAIVRFGNVLDSAGSVVPLFRQQIATGGPVTVTHPDVTRYFMTIPEACQLILQCSDLAPGAPAVFTLDMGQPVAIRELAEQMIRLAGKVPGRDVGIEFTGLRPGEKLHESIFHPDEEHRRTANPRVFRAQARGADPERLARTLARLEQLLGSPEDDPDGWRALLRDAVGDYQPAGDKIVDFETFAKVKFSR